MLNRSFKINPSASSVHRGYDFIICSHSRCNIFADRPTVLTRMDSDSFPHAEVDVASCLAICRAAGLLDLKLPLEMDKSFVRDDGGAKRQ